MAIEGNWRGARSALLLAASLCGCAPQEPLQPVARHDGPSEYEFFWAMEAAEPVHAIQGGEDCRRVRQLQCLPTGNGDSFRCTYRYERDRMGTAVLERERHGFWRWASGPRNCTDRAQD